MDGEFSLWGNPQELLIEPKAHFAHQRSITPCQQPQI